ncbi:phytanoyl-CoA dioxygenase family protein [Paenibacillus tarimensis]|uniref:phytanoyl-CoA dioxygenase family protein n=1 Tax=Paenibacillus tarimensis TaxID=416012 RepID=UPI001F3A7E74|nr:phytanoyl-CoA dioxygenase family protein [Paenibacillus tarimensis]MCF2945192.1 phytanoyl-CoA dioxygenase family protein [Paenibacillus tarimensis]
MGWRILAAEEMEEFHHKGYLVVRQALLPDETERLRAELRRLWFIKYRETGVGPDTRGASSPDRLFPPVRNVHEESMVLREAALDGRIHQLMEQVFGEEALVVGGTGFYKAPGSKELPMHQDNYDIGAAPGTSCAAWISLDHSSEENGGMQFVPGTQSLGMLRPRNPARSSIYAQTVPVPQGYPVETVCTEPGDIILFSGDVLHGSHANTTADRFRMSYVIHYVGVSTEKIFVQQARLLNKRGERVTRRLHKEHAIRKLFREPDGNE